MSAPLPIAVLISGGGTTLRNLIERIRDGSLPVEIRLVISSNPAPLPNYGGKGMYGLKVHEAVLAAGEKITGCTVHFVDNEYDHGPTILQQQVAVLPDDTPQTLQARVFAAECEAYPLVLQRLAA